MKIRTGFWSPIGTALFLVLESQQTWAAGLGPGPGPLAAPGLPLGPGITSDALSEPSLPISESTILLQVMDAVGPSFMSLAINQSWTGEVCNGNKTGWVGVKCTLGKVTDLNLTSNLLSGVLPPQLYLLPNLKSFECRDCFISGALPGQWGQAPSLEMVVLVGNYINGSLPADWGASKTLRHLGICQNRIMGRTPTELYYGMTGTLPEAWGNMSQLQWLDLSRNNISGTLPEVWVNMSQLQQMDLSGNSISGPLPQEWANFELLEALDLSNNQISGTLPEVWGNISQLQQVDLSGNHISGTLPSTYGKLGKMNTFILSSGSRGSERYRIVSPYSLTGTLPSAWATMGSALEEGFFVTISLKYNRLSGPLPQEWASFERLLGLDLSHNQLTGTLPAEWSSLQGGIQFLELQGNAFTGTLPQSWGSMTNLSYLSLDHSRLSGTLPDAWGGMTSVVSLSLSSNRFNGSIPGNSWALGMQSLERLYIQNNSLTGQLPAEWFTTANVFPSLVAIDVRMNKLHGTVPKLGNGSTLLPSINPSPKRFYYKSVIISQSPRLYVWPMAKGYGLCGELPNPGPLLFEFSGEDWYDPWSQAYDKARVTTLPSCKADSQLSMWAMIITAIGCGGLIAIVSGVIYIFMRVRRRKAGSTVGVHHGIDDMQMSKTSKLASHLSHGGMRTEDLIFATEGNNRRVLLGSGAFGQVYKASWHGTDVAVKVLKDDQLEMLLENEMPDDVEKARREQQQQFENEAALLSALRHPNIVNILGFTVCGTDLFMVTELCHGGDLAKAIWQHRHTKAMGWYTRGAKLLLDVACGMAYLHNTGIIHYDIKPGNILLDKHGSTAKISDVGLSKSLATLQGTCSITARGTFEYMAPELKFGRRSTFAVDVYSFGVMLREIITGEAPDKRAAPSREPRIPDECPEAAWRLYWRCIDPNPSNRPSSSELVEHLCELQPPPRAISAALAPTQKDSKEQRNSKAKVF